jgi:transcriptional regulator with XRE-family HTH domain
MKPRKCYFCPTVETDQTEGTLCIGKILRVTKMSQADLARAMQVTPSAVTFYMAGRRTPRPAGLKRLAQILPQDLEEMYHEFE